MPKKCRVCRKEYEPTPYQIRKADFRCKECRRKQDGQWRQKRRALGLPASGSDTWDPRKRAARNKRYYSDPKVKRRRAEAMRRYIQDPRLRIRHLARWYARRRIISGKIKREPCAFCGVMPSEAHHSDYSKPLLIVWLCKSCHRKQHAQAEGRE